MDSVLQGVSTLLDTVIPGSGAAITSGFRGAAPLALVILVVIVALVIWQLRRGDGGSHVVSSRRAFGQSNGMLWSRMRQALPDHVVLMDVPLNRFVTVRRPGGIGQNQRRIDALTADFAVFRSDGTVSSVVLLAESEQSLPRRQAKLRRKLLARAGIKTVSWRLDDMPATEAIALELNPDPTGYLALEKGTAQRGMGMIGAA